MTVAPEWQHLTHIVRKWPRREQCRAGCVCGFKSPWGTRAEALEQCRAHVEQEAK